jgi:hypothetical protein
MWCHVISQISTVDLEEYWYLSTEVYGTASWKTVILILSPMRTWSVLVYGEGNAVMGLWSEDIHSIKMHQVNLFIKIDLTQSFKMWKEHINTFGTRMGPSWLYSDWHLIAATLWSVLVFILYCIDLLLGNGLYTRNRGTCEVRCDVTQ